MTQPINKCEQKPLMRLITLYLWCLPDLNNDAVKWQETSTITSLWHTPCRPLRALLIQFLTILKRSGVNLLEYSRQEARYLLRNHISFQSKAI